MRRSTSLLSILLITMLGLVGFSGAPASAAPKCTPSDAVDAAFSGWSATGDTTDAEVDPDGETGDTNPDNLLMLGEPTSEEVGTGEFVDLVWHNYTGNQPDDAPALDDPKWHAVPALPEGLPHQGQAVNVPYNVSTGESGKGSWFLYTGTEATETVFTWPILSRTFAPGSNAKTCPEVEGEQKEIPGPKDKKEAKPVQVAGEQAAVAPTAPAQVPTNVAAGLGETASGQSDRSPLGLLMVMLGALLTAAAATRRRARA